MITLTVNNPNFKVGVAGYAGKYEDFYVSNVKKELIESAVATLRPDTYYELRGSIPLTFGRHKEVGWYWEVGMPTRAPVDYYPAGHYDAASGTIIFSCYYTPAIMPASQVFNSISTVKVIQEALINGPDSGPSDCVNCKHSWYDHIGHRPPGDTKTYCRIAGCRDCPGYAPAYRYATPFGEVGEC